MSLLVLQVETDLRAYSIYSFEDTDREEEDLLFHKEV